MCAILNLHLQLFKFSQFLMIGSYSGPHACALLGPFMRLPYTWSMENCKGSTHLGALHQDLLRDESVVRAQLSLWNDGGHDN